MEKQKRVIIYISEEDYQRLRAFLILEGQTVSGWFRKIAKQFLDKKDRQS